ncbi:MAG TPA: amidohydrolase family protein [Candidatus Anaerobutyricum stercoripullorum]|uniref:Amidohydrolase family protein n=1 Tax=Candidatus Anaerobutyricum stercoripullorum TaxID=2838456 RepID=A0A9D2BEG4_9FIRM|nr:amidohydrolase family protein [Candidatus Anaerobutyricum stercoripullorum]
MIDFHTHTFPGKISSKVVRKLGMAAHIRAYTDGSMEGLTASMALAGADYSVNLPVMTSPEQVEKINSSMIQHRESLLSQGIIAFGGMHPDYPDYKKEIRRLRENHIAGIKIHPAYQNINLDDIRMLRIIDCASEEGLITLTHAGMDIGIYDRNYCSVAHILKVIDEVHPEKFVLAHMGNWDCWQEVEQDLAGAPVWLDTAFSIGPIAKNPATDETPYEEMNLTDEDFIRLCRKHGTDHILFATDSPWQDQADYISRIKSMSFTDTEKEHIFSENAVALLGKDAFR